MSILEQIKVPYFKQGSEIHIKEKNKGKFTQSAKQHGMGVQEFASHVLSNKAKYSPTLVKRANFAHNAKAWKHQKGGLVSKKEDYIVYPKKEAGTWNKKVYNSVDPTQPYPTSIGGAFGHAIGAVLSSPDELTYQVSDSTSQAAWAKRLHIPYNNKWLPDNGDGTVRLPKEIEAEIPTDTTKLKNTIAANEKLINFYKDMGMSPHSDKMQVLTETIKNDKNTLDALRKTYKTGEPVVINENTYNSRKLIKDGELNLGTTPLNVLHNYTIQYNPNNRTMNYSDYYDFNRFEWGVPGTPFYIKGAVKLK